MSQDELDDFYSAIYRQSERDGRPLADLVVHVRNPIFQRASQLMDARLLQHSTDQFCDQFSELAAWAQARECAAAEQRRWLHQRDREVLR